MKSAKIPLPVTGVDLLSGETSLPEGAVRRAENVDIARDGGFARRKGYELKVAGADFHSLYQTPKGTLVARGSKLYALDTDSFTPTLLCDMGVDAPVDFHRFNEHLYFINEGSLWWVPADESAPRRCGVRLPESLPDVSAADAGALAPGTYAVALSRVDDRGEESPTKVLGQVNLPAGGGIQLTGLPVDLTCSYRVYLTPPDGEALYLAETFSGAFAQYVVTRAPDGAVRTSQHLAPLPAGRFVRGHGGRLYVARDDTLWFSEPLRPHLHDPRHNFVRFAGAIRFIEAVEAGLFVADDRGVWFLTGKDPSQAQLRLMSRARAVARSSLTLSGLHFNRDITQTDMDVAVWLSEEGYVLGRSSGDVVSLHPERVRVAADLEGRSRFVIRNGIKQIITLVAATTTSGYGVAIDTTIQ